MHSVATSGSAEVVWRESKGHVCLSVCKVRNSKIEVYEDGFLNLDYMEEKRTDNSHKQRDV